MRNFNTLFFFAIVFSLPGTLEKENLVTCLFASIFWGVVGLLSSFGLKAWGGGSANSGVHG